MRQLIRLEVLTIFPLASFGPHLVHVHDGFQVILLPTVEKSRSGESEVAGTDNTHRARCVKKGRVCY
jgi:hypothetical protein